MNENQNVLLDKIPKMAQRQDSLKDQLNDLIQVANKLGMYDAADAVTQVYGKADNLGMGCFVEAYKDGEKWFEIDKTCVCDTGEHHNCIYAVKGVRKEQCEHWQPLPFGAVAS